MKRDWKRFVTPPCLVALAAAIGSCRGSPPPTPPLVIEQPPTTTHPSPPPPNEDDAIVALVRGAVQAGLTRGDLTAYLAPWAEDAAATSGRGPEPGPYDVTLSREQIEATRRIVFARMPHAAVSVHAVNVATRGNEARLTWTSTIDFGDHVDEFREEYRLRRTPAGWRIASLRYWPLAQIHSGQRIRFGDRFFRDIDDEIQLARDAHDDRQLLYLLMGGYRFREARALARTLTAGPKADSWAWTMRAETSLMTGDAQDAANSYRMADRIDEPASP